MKKILAILLTAVLLLSLTGCRGKNKAEDPESEVTGEAEQQEMPTDFGKDEQTFALGEGMAYISRENGRLYADDPVATGARLGYALRCVYQDEQYIVWQGRAEDADVVPDEGTGVILLQTGAHLPEGFFFDATEVYCAGARNTALSEAFPAESAFDAEKNVYTARYETSDLSMTVDFAEKTVKTQYDIHSENLGKVLAESEDKRFSVCYAGYVEEGSSHMANIVVRTNATGELRWLGVESWDGCEYGFFRNGNLWFLQPLRLKIFTGESGFTQQLPIGISFGLQENGATERVLHALRCDPADEHFVIVYCEGVRGVDFTNGNFNNICYKVGILDPLGNLKASYPSTQKVLNGNNRFGYVDLTEENGVFRIRAYQSDPDTPLVDFTFTEATGEFTY